MVASGEQEGTAVRYVPAAEIVRRIPGRGTGRPMHRAAAFRWAMRGLTAPSGEEVKLKTIRLGGRLLTTEEWFNEFVAALNPDTVPAVAPRSPGTRERAAERAAKELAQAGW